MAEVSYLTQGEAAKLLRLSSRTLERQRLDGTGPLFVKAGIHDIRRVELAAYADCQAFTAVLIQNVQRPEDLSVVGSVVDKIIRPDVVAVLWS